MIKLQKLSEPHILSINKEEWKKELMKLISSWANIPDSKYKKYNQPEVKDSIKKECFSKCMYCESKVEHITDLHIEHIKPKAKDKFPELTFEYENLWLACPECNMNKSDIFDTTLPFINPYIEEPDEFFYACWPMIFPKTWNRRAKLTELIIKINRTELVAKRIERINTLRWLLESFESEKNWTLKAALKKEISIEIEKDKEYSFCCVKFISGSIIDV